jgi:hypothetical protein
MRKDINNKAVVIQLLDKLSKVDHLINVKNDFSI